MPCRTEGPARPPSPAGAAGSVPRTAPRPGSFPPTVPRLRAGGDTRAAESPPRRPPPALAAAAARSAPIRPHGAVLSRAAPPELGLKPRRSPSTARSLPLRCPRGGRVQSGAGTGGAGRVGLLRARVPLRERRWRRGRAALWAPGFGESGPAAPPGSYRAAAPSVLTGITRSLPTPGSPEPQPKFAPAASPLSAERSRGSSPELQPGRCAPGALGNSAMLSSAAPFWVRLLLALTGKKTVILGK